MVEVGLMHEVDLGFGVVCCSSLVELEDQANTIFFSGGWDRSFSLEGPPCFKHELERQFEAQGLVIVHRLGTKENKQRTSFLRCRANSSSNFFLNPLI